jgi:pyruvate formate lyase activating enzyme
VVFLKGCPFRCRYCHNPDTWAGTDATEVTADELLARALRYRAYWGETGGITVSGGEPLLQPEFVLELFEKAKAHGVSTCLDTAAGPFVRRGPEGIFERLFAVTDTVLLDIKHMDPAAHRDLTGADNASVLDCARYLDEIGKNVWIRHVLVPGFTDAPEHLKQLASFVATLTNVQRVDILPYHTFGIAKWKALGLPYTLEGVAPPTARALAAARSLFDSESGL